jgi:hypothetical protein
MHSLNLKMNLNRMAAWEQATMDADIYCAALYLFMVSIPLVAIITLSKPGHMPRAEYSGHEISWEQTSLTLESGSLDTIPK